GHGARVLLVERDREVRVALVVAVPDVEPGPVALDQVVFEVERLDLVRDDDPFDVAGRLDHRRGPRMEAVGVLEVARQAAPERERLADVDHPPVDVLEQVDAGLFGERRRRGTPEGLGGHTPIVGAGRTPGAARAVHRGQDNRVTPRLFRQPRMVLLCRMRRRRDAFSSTERVEREVERLAAAQHGVISRRQAVDGGATRAFIERRVASGRWLTLFPRVYRMAGAARSWRQQVMAACLACGDAAAASHRCAGALVALPGLEKGTVVISVPRRRLIERLGIVVYRVSDAARAVVTRLDG